MNNRFDVCPHRVWPWQKGCRKCVDTIQIELVAERRREERQATTEAIARMYISTSVAQLMYSFSLQYFAAKTDFDRETAKTQMDLLQKWSRGPEGPFRGR